MIERRGDKRLVRPALPTELQELWIRTLRSYLSAWLFPIIWGASLVVGGLVVKVVCNAFFGLAGSLYVAPSVGFVYRVFGYCNAVEIIGVLLISFGAFIALNPRK